MTETKDKTILIVEDDEPILEYLNSAVRKDGFSTRVARDGSEASRLISSNNFDLIILDLMLPGKSGIEIIKSLQSYEYRNIPVIAITARFDAIQLSHMLQFETNVKEQLVKPINADFLLAKIHSLLGTKSQEEIKAIEMKKNISGEPIIEKTEGLFNFETIAVTESNIRRHSRITVDLPANIFIAESQSDKGKGRIVDISLSGFAFETYEDLFIDTEIYMKISLSNLSVDFFGTITRKKKTTKGFYKYGAKLTRSTTVDKIKLKNQIIQWVDSQKR